jgi:hypothetical protein
VTFTPADTVTTWLSGNADIVIVDKNSETQATVTAVKRGSSVVTVTGDYGASATLNVEVVDAPEGILPGREGAEYYLRARYYEPGTGRFLSEDTHWNTGNMIYGDDPIKWNERERDEDDPLGLNTFTYKPDNLAIFQSGKWNERERDENDPLGLNTFTYKPDNLAISQSGNLYVYGISNPLMYIDPSGKLALTAPAFLALLFFGSFSLLTLADPNIQKGIHDGLEILAKSKSKPRTAKPRSPYAPARRDRSNTQKEAYEKAKRAGNGKEPIHHTDGEHGPHYHPNVPTPKNPTPHVPSPHDHYYY